MDSSGFDAWKKRFHREFEDIVTDFRRANSLGWTLMPFLEDASEVSRSPRLRFCEKLAHLFEQGDDKQEECVIIALVALLENQLHEPFLRCLTDFVDQVLESGLLRSRQFFEKLINSPNFNFENKSVCSTHCGLISRHLSSLHYKGARDLLTQLLGKLNTIPKQPSHHQAPAVDSWLKLLSRMISRSSGLLPSIFVVNEIMKVFPADSNHPNQAVTSLLLEMIYTFIPLAGIVSTIAKPHLVPISGLSDFSNSWNLEPTTLFYTLKSNLPYSKELLTPQKDLLKHMLLTPGSKTLLQTVVFSHSKEKQPSALCRECFLDVILDLVNMTDPSRADYDIIFGNVWVNTNSIISKNIALFGTGLDYIKDITQRMTRNPLPQRPEILATAILQMFPYNFQVARDAEPLLNLIEIIYPEREPLPLPDFDDSKSSKVMSAAVIWCAVQKLAKDCGFPINRHPPTALLNHIQLLSEENMDVSLENYLFPVYINLAVCTNNTSNLMLLLMGRLCDMKRLTRMPYNTTVPSPATAPRMAWIDSLTQPAKQCLLQAVLVRMADLVKSPGSPLPSPCLVETCCRLFCTTDYNNQAIQMLTSLILQQSINSQLYGWVQVVAEMLTYRLVHFQLSYCLYFIVCANCVMVMDCPLQLRYCIENSMLRIMMHITPFNLVPLVSARLHDIHKHKIFSEYEEVNKFFLLKFAQASHIYGLDDKAMKWLAHQLNENPSQYRIVFPEQTLEYFPQAIRQLLMNQTNPTEPPLDMKTAVDRAVQIYNSTTSDEELLQVFCSDGSPVLICVIFKVLTEKGTLRPVLGKLLTRLGSKSINAQLRMLADYIVYKFNHDIKGSQVSIWMGIVYDMIFKYHLFPLEKLILALAFRTYEPNGAVVAGIIIGFLLLKPADFRSRLSACLTVQSSFWTQGDFLARHVSYHNEHPEFFNFEGFFNTIGLSSQTPPAAVTTYFSNVCFRLLPVLDLVIDMVIELQDDLPNYEALLDFVGNLYKYHSHRIHFLYTTLHYYERKLQTKTSMKRHIVKVVLGLNTRPTSFPLTPVFVEYVTQADASWTPPENYYISHVKNLVEAVGGDFLRDIGTRDWRFFEFLNPMSCRVITTCIEILAIPVLLTDVGRNLISILMLRNESTRRHVLEDSLPKWINCIGLLMSLLPMSCREVLYDGMVSIMTEMTSPPADPATTVEGCPSFLDPTRTDLAAQPTATLLLATAHALWQHLPNGRLESFPRLLREKFVPAVTNELQLLYLLSFCGPVLPRFQPDRVELLFEIAVDIYQMLVNVSRTTFDLVYADPICDFLYLIKYMYVGDMIAKEVHKVFHLLHPMLKKRLQFIIQTGTK